MTRSDSSSAGHPGSRGWWGGEAGSVFSRLLTRVYPSMISSSSSTGQVTAEVIKGVMWGSSGGGVAILLFSILTFSSPISSGLVLPGFVFTSTGCLTHSMSATGRTISGGRSHLDLDNIWSFDLDDLDGSSRTLALSVAGGSSSALNLMAAAGTRPE